MSSSSIVRIRDHAGRLQHRQQLGAREILGIARDLRHVADARAIRFVAVTIALPPNVIVARIRDA